MDIAWRAVVSPVVPLKDVPDGSLVRWPDDGTIFLVGREDNCRKVTCLSDGGVYKDTTESRVHLVRPARVENGVVIFEDA